MTKTEFVSALLNKNPSLSKSQIIELVDSIHAVVVEGLKSEGTAIVPGVVKIKAVKKAATKERQGLNPFTKQPITIPARPASTKVKATAQKPLKDAVV